jgi:hypothetical protein
MQGWTSQRSDQYSCQAEADKDELLDVVVSSSSCGISDAVVLVTV